MSARPELEDEARLSQGGRKREEYEEISDGDTGVLI